MGSIIQKSQLGIFSVRKNCTNGNPVHASLSVILEFHYIFYLDKNGSTKTVKLFLLTVKLLLDATTANDQQNIIID